MPQTSSLVLRSARLNIYVIKHPFLMLLWNEPLKWFQESITYVIKWYYSGVVQFSDSLDWTFRLWPFTFAGYLQSYVYMDCWPYQWIDWSKTQWCALCRQKHRHRSPWYLWLWNFWQQQVSDSSVAKQFLSAHLD